MKKQPIDHIYYLISKYVMICFAMRSSLEDIKDTIIFKQGIKFHTNKLIELLERELDSKLHTDVFNSEDQALAIKAIVSIEGLSDKIAQLNTSEKIILNKILDDILSYNLPEVYKKKKV